MTSKPFKEGDWFAVPLESGYVLGRIARIDGPDRSHIVLGYLFGPLRPSVPRLEDAIHLTAYDAINIVMFGDLGLTEEDWPIIPNTGTWNRDEWPLPPFGRIIDSHRGIGRYAEYDDGELHYAIYEIEVTAEHALQFPEDVLCGHMTLQSQLEHFFNGDLSRSADDMPRRPRLRFHGLPTMTLEII